MVYLWCPACKERRIFEEMDDAGRCIYCTVTLEERNEEEDAFRDNVAQWALSKGK